MVGMSKKEGSGKSKLNVAATSEEGMDSPFSIYPSPEGAAASGPDEMALAPCREELELGEDFFIWPNPIDPHKALFMVDNMAKRAMWVGTYQSYEEV